MKITLEGSVAIYSVKEGRVIPIHKTNALLYGARNVILKSLAAELNGAAAANNGITGILLANKNIVDVLDTMDPRKLNYNDIVSSSATNFFYDTSAPGEEVTAYIPFTATEYELTRDGDNLIITPSVTRSYSPVADAEDTFSTLTLSVTIPAGALSLEILPGEHVDITNPKNYLSAVVVLSGNPLEVGVPVLTHSAAVLPTDILLSPDTDYKIVYTYKIK